MRFVLPYTDGLPQVTIDGDIFHVYKTYVRAKFEKHEFSLPVGFSTKPDFMALVGRSGFFETFKIEFDELGKQTILRPYELL